MSGQACQTCRHFDLDRPAPGAQVVKGRKTGRMVIKYPCAKRGGGRYEATDKCKAWEAQP